MTSISIQQKIKDPDNPLTEEFLTLRKHRWDEEDRLRGVDLMPDNDPNRPEIASYTYDASGERVVRYVPGRLDAFYNASNTGFSDRLESFVYPSGLVTLKTVSLKNIHDFSDFDSKLISTYTKHYYISTSLNTGIGSERISSALGTIDNLGALCADIFHPEVTDQSFMVAMIQTADQKVVQAAQSLQDDYNYFEKQLNLPSPFLYNGRFSKCRRTHHPERYAAYWFHPDHLGSSSYISNLSGEISQHLEYLPFGETLVEEHKNSNNSPYKFNAKELDDETGNYYYGARYLNPKWSFWLSVDPLAEKYPRWSPYNYTLQNPVRLIDPDGNSPMEPARNQAGTIRQAIRQWRDAGLTTVKQIMNFVKEKNINGGAAIRYIYTNNKGWIDMQHYAGVQIYGKLAMDLLEPASGNSVMQSLFFGEGADKSYYSYEDLPSNSFSAEINLKGLEGEDLFSAILEHFENADATIPTNAPNYNQIPQDDQDRLRLPEKKIIEFDDSSPSRINTRLVPDESKLRTGNYIPQNRTENPYNLNDFDPANTSIDKMGRQ